MGLTRPRAYQIYDLDYKQSVRVISLSNVNLTGGAPASVDGVSLSAGDRILVAGQSTGSQNGLYQVSVLGTGSNGTWIRSIDGNETGEIEAGMIVMVTEGVVYKDTQWKLTTNDPIVIGTTPLAFEQNSAYAFGNIFANGTAVLANTVGDTLTLSAGNNIQITGNATAKSVTIGVVGISLNSINNGTSNVNVVSSGGNITVGVNGTNNTAVFGQYFSTFAGNVVPSANITYDLGTSTQRWKDIWLSNSTIYLGNAQISANATSLILTNPLGGNIVLSGATSSISASTITATGNITGGNIGTAGQVTATGNVTGGNIISNAALSATTVTATGNITGGNLSGTLITGTLTTAAQPNITSVGSLTSLTVTGNVIGGNLGTAGQITATGNITGGNLSGTLVTGTLTTAAQPNVTSVGTLSALTVTGNITGGNLGTAGQITATGNITGGNLRTSTVTIGSTGAISGVTTFSASGNANVGNIGATAGVFTGAVSSSTTITATGNITGGNLGTAGQVTATGNITGGNLSTAGQINATGNIRGGNLVSNAAISATTTITATGNVSGGNLTTVGQITATGNITGGNLSGTLVTGTLTTAAQPNITSVGTLSSLTVVGPSTHTGNIDVTGNINVTGNLNYANVTDLVVGDPLIFLGANNSGNVVDLGEVVQWNPGTGTQYGGLVRDASDGIWKLFGNVTAVPTTTVDFTNALYQSIQVGPLTASSGSFSTTVTATGNITGGNITTAGTVAATDVSTTGNITVQNRKILFFNDDDNSNYVALRAPGTLAGNYTYILPVNYGNASQVLTTNGAGGLTWEDAGSGGAQGSIQYPNSTVQPVPGATGNFDLSYNFAQTVQEVPFETSTTDPFGVNLGEVYSMMDPVGEVLDPVDLGVLT